MLNVFQRRAISNVCCVVTRYFGGVLLGAGGLTRAYTRGASDVLGSCRTQPGVACGSGRRLLALSGCL